MIRALETVRAVQEVLLHKDVVLITVLYASLVKKGRLEYSREFVHVHLVQEVHIKTELVPSFVSCVRVALSVLFSELVMVMSVEDVLLVLHPILASLHARGILNFETLGFREVVVLSSYV